MPNRSLAIDMWFGWYASADSDLSPLEQGAIEGDSPVHNQKLGHVRLLLNESRSLGLERKYGR